MKKVFLSITKGFIFVAPLHFKNSFFSIKNTSKVSSELYKYFPVAECINSGLLEGEKYDKI